MGWGVGIWRRGRGRKRMECLSWFLIFFFDFEGGQEGKRGIGRW